jgi:hypothetical protein
MATRMGSGGAAAGAAKPFELCPPGPQQLVCCDVINHGIVTTPGFGQNSPPRDVHKITIVWQSQYRMKDKDNLPYIVKRRYTLSSHKKAALRGDLEDWRGRPFTQKEADDFDTDTLIGVNCFAQIVHERKTRGTFAEITSIMKLPKQFKPMKVDPRYERVIDPNAEATRHLWDPDVKQPGAPADVEAAAGFDQRSEYDDSPDDTAPADDDAPPF